MTTKRNKKGTSNKVKRSEQRAQSVTLSSMDRDESIPYDSSLDMEGQILIRIIYIEEICYSYFSGGSKQIKEHCERDSVSNLWRTLCFCLHLRQRGGRGGGVGWGGEIMENSARSDQKVSMHLRCILEKQDETRR